MLRVPEARRKTSFETPFGPSFGVRHVSRKPARKAPFRNLLRNPSESATCLKSHAERPFRFFLRNVPCVPKPQPKALRNHLRSMPRVPSAEAETTLRMPCEKCHVSRVPKPSQPSGCRVRVPRVPSDLADRSLRMLCESATRPESPTERTLRIKCECAMCPGSPNREPPSGCCPSSPRVPRAQAERPLPDTF